MAGLKRERLAIKGITITDSLFAHYAKIISEEVIPYQWNILNDQLEGSVPSHCLDNFRIAAGEKEGTHYGVVFQDTDAYKWLETLSYCIEKGDAESFIPYAESLIDLIGKAQQPDGYLNTYYTIKYPDEKWTNLLEGHELYSAGHLIEAAVAYHHATGKRKILDIAIKLADHIVERFHPDKSGFPGYPGHQEIELALVKLFRVTANKMYLETAAHFIKVRGEKPNYFDQEVKRRGDKRIFPEFKDIDSKYSHSHQSPVTQCDMDGHAVRAMYMCSAMADLACELEDEELKNTCENLWNSTTGRRMYITGGIGSSGFLERFTADFDLPNDRMYCESCASVGLMMFGQRMSLLSGNAQYQDAVERALFNTVLAGINVDGKKYFYVNPQEVWPSNCIPGTSMDHVKPVRQKWFDVACCPTNIARTISSLGQYIYFEDDEALYVNQLISSTINSERYNFSMDADLTGDGSIKISTAKDLVLKIRIPDYMEDREFKVKGELVSPEYENGYALVTLSGGETLEIRSRIMPQWISSREEVRSNLGKAALQYGPFVYCLEEQDNGPGLAAIGIFSDCTFNLESRLTDLPGALPLIKYKAGKIHSSVSTLYGKYVFSCEEKDVAAIPYALWCNRNPGEMLIWQHVFQSVENQPQQADR